MGEGASDTSSQIGIAALKAQLRVQKRLRDEMQEAARAVRLWEAVSRILDVVEACDGDDDDDRGYARKRRKRCKDDRRRAWIGSKRGDRSTP